MSDPLVLCFAVEVALANGSLGDMTQAKTYDVLVVEFVLLKCSHYHEKNLP